MARSQKDLSRVNKGIEIRMDEFLLILKIMRVSIDAPAVQGAYLVLFEGKTQKQAFEQSGSSAGNVCNTLAKIRKHHESIMEAYASRLCPEPVESAEAA